MDLDDLDMDIDYSPGSIDNSDESDEGMEDIEEAANIKTHRKLSTKYYGNIISIEDSEATTKFKAHKDMINEHTKEVYSGFIDMAGQFCAIATVNEENLTISQIASHFVKPIKGSEEIIFHAHVEYFSIPKQIVYVIGKCDDTIVYKSSVSILVHEEHIFEISVDTNHNDSES